MKYNLICPGSRSNSDLLQLQLNELLMRCRDALRPGSGFMSTVRRSPVNLRMKWLGNSCAHSLRRLKYFDAESYLPWIVFSQVTLSQCQFKLKFVFEATRYMAARDHLELPTEPVLLRIYSTHSQMTQGYELTTGKTWPKRGLAIYTRRFGIFTTARRENIVHELVHAVIDAEFPWFPHAVNEGLALHFQSLRKGPQQQWVAPRGELAAECLPLALKACHRSSCLKLFLGACDTDAPEWIDPAWMIREHPWECYTITGMKQGAYALVMRYLNARDLLRPFLDSLKIEIVGEKAGGKAPAPDLAYMVLEKVVLSTGVTSVEDDFRLWLLEEHEDAVARACNHLVVAFDPHLHQDQIQAIRDRMDWRK